MSKLAALRKQISALEAKAERLAKLEMTSSIAKVKAMMHSMGVTVEHLGASVSATVKKVTSGNPGIAKKTRAKSSGAGVAKYADPKSGRTWSGFGRAPAWIASAKDRAVFLVHKADATATVAPTKKGAKTAKTVKKAAGKVATKKKPVAKKVARVAKTAAAAPANAAASAKKRAAKPVSAKKTAARKAAAKKAAPAKVEAAASPTAA
jgi:DNA-binding protein H-NS